MKLLLWMVGLTLFGLCGYWLAQPQDVRAYALAVVGPMTGPNAEVGQQMRKGAELAVAEANKLLAANNVRLQLLVVDDESDPQSRYRPQEIAGDLAKNPQLLGVIGHAFGVPTMVALPAYAKASIPVISPTASLPAVTKGRDNSFAMMLSDPQQGTYLAGYALTALKRKRIAVVMPVADGTLLGQAFVAELERNSVQPAAVITFDERSSPETLNNRLEALHSADLIVLALGYETAAKVARHLRAKQIKADFMGGEEIGSARFIAEAGIGAEHTYAMRSFLPELLGQQGRQFVQQFYDSFQQIPGSIAANSYEATMLMAHAIHGEGATRDGIRRALAAANAPDKGFSIMGSAIYFDSEGVNQRLVGIGRVEQGRFIAAEFQSVAVKNMELAALQESKPIPLNGQWIRQSTVMYTGIRIQQVSDLNIVTGRFKANFDVWFRWHGRDHKEIDFELSNGAIQQRTELEHYHDAATGEKYVAYNVDASFVKEFDMRDYPFDVQTLKIRVRPKQFTTEEVFLVKDLSERNYLAQPLAMGVWQDTGHQEYVDQDSFYYTLRNPQFDKVSYEMQHTVFNYDIRIKRKVLQYMIKLIPLLVVMLAAYLSFFLDVNTALAPRLSVCITALLSAVAFHMSQSTNAANIGYLIKADYFFMLTYWLIFFTLAEAIVSKRIQVRGDPGRATRLDHSSSWIYLFIMFSAIAIMVTT